MRFLFYIVDNPPNMRIKARAFGISQPLGAGYLASALREDGHEVRIFDHSVNTVSSDELKEYISDFNPDLVGFTTFTFSVGLCSRMARTIKDIIPRAKIVFGGPHATYLAEEVLKEPAVDIVVLGEGEATICEVVRALSNGEELAGVKGIFYKDKTGQTVRNPAREPIPDIDTIPFPAYDLMDMAKYYPSVNRRFTDRKFGSIITSRGCPYTCTFCSHQMFGKKIRMRSPRNVVDEIELLAKEYGVGELIFLDDTFTVDEGRVAGICELMINRGLKIIWSCNTRADHASAELYSVMYNAGCRSVHIGVESASQTMLDSMKKGITIDEIISAVALAKKHIGHVVCGFIFGMPGDTLEGARETIEFAKRLDPDYATFNIALPVPGSEIYDMAVRDGLVDKSTAPWENFLEMLSPSAPVMELSEIRGKELVKLAQQGFREFYFRPSYLLSRVLKLRSTLEIFHYLRGLQAILNYEFLRK